MIKIDLHLHTIPSLDKTESFSFSLNLLEKYVSERGLNVIAITNHNLFDRSNFDLIRNHLPISVFPGIEVDLESGHILVISNNIDIDDFDKKCATVNSMVSLRGKLSIEEFLLVFSEKEKYIFIPHYQKKPKITEEIIKKFGKDIFCGEVDNQNKFIRSYKDKGGLVPVLFSDARFSDETKIPMRFTYLDTCLTDFGSVKEALKDREKVYLTDKKAHSYFQILKDGTMASTGLNIVLGKRSSGKTHTLSSIYDNFLNNQKIKYIRQFDLIEKNSNDKEEQSFNEKLGEKSSLFTTEYLHLFKGVVDSVQKIDLQSENTRVSDYIVHLLEFASDVDKHDVFARIPIFSDQNYSVINTNNISELISAVLLLLSNKEYEEIINKHIPRDSLVSLFKDLVDAYKAKAITIKAIEFTNEIIDCLKQTLTVESNQNLIPNFDIITYSRNILEISAFQKLISVIDSEAEIKNKKMGRFIVSAKRLRITTASDLQKVFKNKTSYSQFVSLRNKPYDYLLAFKNANIIPLDELYKIFIRIEFSVLNADGLKVSGGERAEFNFEEKLLDADNYEMLLIDEPESSFDNIFLKDYIYKRIKSLSNDMPVFVSTHNNVVGASYKPNYILYTEKTIEHGTPVFRVYGGEPTEKLLSCCDGQTTLNKLAQLNCLEGGEDAYLERKNTYENIKN